jgi:PTH1 family peptidyl-tRNA hydrolase
VKIVLGLGNPGKDYAGTRHNIGFLVLDEIALRPHVGFASKRSLESLVARRRVREEEVLLIKPQTFMNRSGRATVAVLQRFPVGIQDLVVVHDDLDLPFGRIRIRARGRAAGHRGIQSILDALGSESFVRVRVGIGRPPPGVDPIDYVLEPFGAEESLRLENIIVAAADAVICTLTDGPKAAMDKFNRINLE